MIDTDSRETSVSDGTKVTVYSTSDNIKVVFSNRDVECGAWITERQASELIGLLAAVIHAVPATPVPEEVAL